MLPRNIIGVQNTAMSEKKTYKTFKAECSRIVFEKDKDVANRVFKCCNIVAMYLTSC